jgi:hypothetical protein
MKKRCDLSVSSSTVVRTLHRGSASEDIVDFSIIRYFKAHRHRVSIVLLELASIGDFYYPFAKCGTQQIN